MRSAPKLGCRSWQGRSSERLGGDHEVIYSQTTAELQPQTEIGQSLSLSRGCTAGASLDSAVSIPGHYAGMITMDV